jgi:predicted transcriptional regulator
MAIKSTFVLDDLTAQTIRRLAERTRKSQSLVVREAVAHYAAREEKSTVEEQDRWLNRFDELVAHVAPRDAREIEKEQARIRTTRRAGYFIRCLPPRSDHGRVLWLVTHERVRRTGKVRSVIDFLYTKLKTRALELETVRANAA